MFGKKQNNLSRLSPETAEIYKKMISPDAKKPLRSSMTLFYPGGTGDEEPETPRAASSADTSGARTVRDGAGSPARRFTLSSIKREPASVSRAYPSLSFPDLSGGGTDESSSAGPEPAAPAHVRETAVPRGTAADEYVTWTPKKEGDAADSQRTGGTILEVNRLYKGYVKGKNLIPVLNGVDIQVRDGEFLAIVGQSGSGKSTLLHLMGTLDVPDSGTVHFDGQRIDNLPSRRRDFLRNHYIGMIFQFYHLIPEMNMIENVLAPLMVRESLFGYLRRRREYMAHAKELLDLVGLSHRLRHRPNELSGGEMQRTSIARALITNPRVLLADEPTGNLDSKTTVEIIKLLRSLNAEKKLTIIMVTHDMEQARDADRVVRLVDGQVVESFLTGV